MPTICYLVLKLPLSIEQKIRNTTDNDQFVRLHVFMSFEALIRCKHNPLGFLKGLQPSIAVALVCSFTFLYLYF